MIGSRDRGYVEGMERPYVRGRRFVVDDLRRTLHQAKASRVVSLEQVRELEALLNKERSRAAVERGQDIVAALSQSLYLFHGARLLEWISSTCAERGAGKRTTPEEIARTMLEWPAFRRLSRIVRHHYAGFTDVSTAEVRSHLRLGRKVHGHFRLLGDEHLRDLPVDRWSPIVGKVIRAMLSVLERRRRHGTP